MSSLAAALEGPQDRYTLEFALPGRHSTPKRRYHLDVEILLPLVKGVVHLNRGRGVLGVEGRVSLLEHHKTPHRSEGWNKGEYLFRIQGSSEEVRVEFGLSFLNGLGDVITFVREGVSSHESDDLCRNLARLLQRAGEQLEQASSLCEQLAEAEAPADRLAYAEALWAYARLLLVVGRDGAGAERAAQGSEQAARSGLPLSVRMSQSGKVLASALRWSRQTEAAEQVRRSLINVSADGREA